MAIGFTNDKERLANERAGYMFSQQNLTSKAYAFVNTGQTGVMNFLQRGIGAVPGFGGARPTGLQVGQVARSKSYPRWITSFVEGDVLGFCLDTTTGVCQLFKNGEPFQNSGFTRLNLLQNRGNVYFYVELSVPGDQVHSVRIYFFLLSLSLSIPLLIHLQTPTLETQVRFPRSRTEAVELQKELNELCRDDDIAELMKVGVDTVEAAKD